MDMDIDTKTQQRVTECNDLIKLTTGSKIMIHRRIHEEAPQATEEGDGAPMEGPWEPHDAQASAYRHVELFAQRARCSPCSVSSDAEQSIPGSSHATVNWI